MRQKQILVQEPSKAACTSAKPLNHEGVQPEKLSLIPSKLSIPLLLDLGSGVTVPYKPYLCRVGSYVALDLRASRQVDIVADARALPFRDRSFGFAWVSEVLEHIEPQYQQQVLNEIARVALRACVTYPAEGHPNFVADPSHRPVRVSDTRFRRLTLPKNEIALLYDANTNALIGLVGDDAKQHGGSNEVIEHLRRALEKMGHVIEFYTPSYVQSKNLPHFLQLLSRPLQAVRIARRDLSEYDAIITLHPFSHYLRHKRHLMYFLHHQRLAYDLLQATLQQVPTFGKIRLGATAFMVRLIDKLLLQSNLKRSKIVAISYTVLKRLHKYNGISNIEIVHPGGYIENDGRMQSADPPIALSFSRLHLQRKGIDTILKIARLVPEIEFIIAGSPDSSLRSMDTIDLPENVTIMIKNWRYEERNELYARCSIFLAPYLDEDFGITPLEANSFGKPVVYCRDGGGIRESQNHLFTGYMAERSPEDLARGVRYCLKYGPKMAKHCIENAKRFTWEKFEDAMLVIISNLLQKSEGNEMEQAQVVSLPLSRH